MRDALAHPKHPDHGEVAEYLETWDPTEIDETSIRIVLRRITNRRNAVRTSIAKKTT